MFPALLLPVASASTSRLKGGKAVGTPFTHTSHRPVCWPVIPSVSFGVIDGRLRKSVPSMVMLTPGSGHETWAYDSKRPFARLNGHPLWIVPLIWAVLVVMTVASVNVTVMQVSVMMFGLGAPALGPDD